ncbi:MAG: putative D-isomer specific 2-hydroxyacid dehydrogenase NAD-binding [Candidatus Peregrinibacteria bacterium Gr01-1014_25]|nr:MAG: putative D-isomer specific 2-hydroxyacid dehydrogenase NAD-binding [Candidatus Peregrinibacteria bacterium Gr01-1014_25]
MMPRIVVALGDRFAPEALQILRGAGDVRCETFTRRDLLAALGDAEVLIIGLDHIADRVLFDASPKLKVIATPTTGLDHVDVAVAESRGIAVVNLRGADDVLREVTATAELAWGLLLALLRRIVPAGEAVRRGEWARDAFMGTSLAGKTLGVVGVGRLGGMVARYGRCFGMTVLGCDPAPSDRILCDEWLPLDAMLPRCDAVSLHVHLTSDTERLINARMLGLLRPSAVLVNTARGRVVDEAAILDALRSGRLAGYAADVLDGELTFDASCSAHPLVAYVREHDEVLLTPHIGGMTREARTVTDVFIAQKIAGMLGAGFR